jgi:hypothetical protein
MDFIGRLEVEQTIQLAVEAAPMRYDGAVGEIGPPATETFTGMIRLNCFESSPDEGAVSLHL